MASIRVSASSPVDEKETNYLVNRDLKQMHLVPGKDKSQSELVWFYPQRVCCCHGYLTPQAQKWLLTFLSKSCSISMSGIPRFGW